MYPVELEIKDTPESNTSAPYLDLLPSIGRDGQLYTSSNMTNVHLTHFPFMCSNFPSSPAYVVFISYLIRYVWACYSYWYFILRAMRVANELLGQGYVSERLKSPLKFYCRYGDLIKQYEIPLSRMLNDIMELNHIQWYPPPIRLLSKRWLYYRHWSLTKLWTVFKEHICDV